MTARKKNDILKGDNMNKCRTCEHKEFCNAGTEDCNSYAPIIEVYYGEQREKQLCVDRYDYLEAFLEYTMDN